MDGLRFVCSRAAAVGAALALVLASGCSHEKPPKRLADGALPGEFRPVRGSVLTQARTMRRTTLGPRFSSCFSGDDAERFSGDTLVLERIGVDSQSLTFIGPRGDTVYGCDGGAEPTGERAEPWCGSAAGRLFDGRLLDPRLDVLCLAPDGLPLAYAFVEPISSARWIGVDQGSYTEIYEVLAGLPVRVATTRHVQREGRATFVVTQYDREGQELTKQTLEAAVAG